MHAFPITEKTNPDTSRPKRHRRRPRLGDESGVAILEFAMVLPFLMLIVVVILDFGRALNYWVDTTHLASEGARLAAVDRIPSGTSLQDYIRDRADTAELRDGGSQSIPDELEVCVNPVGNEVGDPVEVQVRTTYNWIPLLHLSEASTTITGSATMRRERLATAVSAGCS
jgi:Flp pilus assembly protein TadG